MHQFQVSQARNLTSVEERGLSKRIKKANRRVTFAEPKTELARRLLEIRREIENSDIELLTLEEVRAEVRESRGERD